MASMGSQQGDPRAHSGRDPQPRSGITVHCRVRNEECFVRAAISSVLPLAEQVLVYDTGSTDRTLEEIRSIRSPKIELVATGQRSPLELAQLRNEMIDRTTTEWCMIVDGDEIYPAHAVARIAELIPTIPDSIHRIAVHRRHFVSAFNFVSGTDRIGRIYRRATIRHGIASSRVANAVGHETPYLVANPSTPWAQFSRCLPADVWFFHCQYLVRSSKDADMGRLRGWRQPPFPVRPYFGPWPEALHTGPVAMRWTAALARQWIALNARAFAAYCRHYAGWMPREWQLRRWPPKDLLLSDSFGAAIGPIRRQRASDQGSSGRI